MIARNIDITSNNTPVLVIEGYRKVGSPAHKHKPVSSPEADQMMAG